MNNLQFNNNRLKNRISKRMEKKVRNRYKSKEKVIHKKYLNQTWMSKRSQKDHKNLTDLKEVVDVEVEIEAIMRVEKREDSNYHQVVSVLTNYAHQRKFLRRSDQELKITSIDFSVEHATIITITIYIVNFVSKFTQQTAKIKMMTNGLDAIIARDGYFFSYVESYRV